MRKQEAHKGLCEVTFELPAAIAVSAAHVCGDFNDWDPTATPMTRDKDGSLHASLSLDVGRRYRFRYLLEDGRWENDWNADDYVTNDFGGEDSVVAV